MRISIICPNCRAKLSFNEMPNWQEKLVECPHCHFKAKANVYQSGALGQGGQGADESATELPSSFHMPRNGTIGVIKLVSTGHAYQLKEGTNVLGRNAASCTADIKIDTTDMTMSRRHLHIDVVKTEWGFEHRLVEIGAKNNIVLNGNPIHRGDILKLEFGDKMTLGQTDVIFDRPQPTDEEATQLV